MPKISELAMGGPLTGDELIPVVQSGVTNQITMDQVAVFVASGAEGSAFVDGSDIYATITAEIAALGSAGGAIHIPAGTYTCSNSISLTKPVHLTGDAGVGNVAVATKITFPVNKTGIIVEYPFQGIGSRIEGLALVSSGGTTGHGIDMNATATVRDCQITGFPENGIELFGNVPDSNTNGFYIENVIIRECGGDGVHTEGGDGNAGTGVAIQIFDCGGWGINDDGFLGNTWVGCQTDSNVTGAYTTSQSSARSAWLGCYSEGNQPTSVFSQWSFVIGGLQAAGVTGGVALQDGRITPFGTLSTSLSGSDSVSIIHGYQGTVADVTGASLNPIQLGFWNGPTNTLEVRYAYLDAGVAQVWTTQSCGYTDRASAAVPVGQTLFPNGIWTPNGSSKFIKQFPGSADGSTATPDYIDLGGSYANSTAQSKCKVKVVNAGVAADIYGIGATGGFFEMHASTGTTYTWCWNSVAILQTTETVFSPVTTLGMGLGSASLVWSNLFTSRVLTPLRSGLTIASGVITVTGGYHTVDTEAAAASDDLDTISGGVDGARLVLRAVNSARTVVVKDGTGNIQCAGDFSLDNAQDTVELIYDGALTAWLEIGRSDNGA